MLYISGNSGIILRIIVELERVLACFSGLDFSFVLSNLNVVTEPQVVTIYCHRHFSTMTTKIH